MSDNRARLKTAAAAALLTAGALTAALLSRTRPAGAPPAPAETRFLQRPAEFVVDVPRSEETCDRTAGDVKGTFLKGLRHRDWSLAATGLTEDFLGRFPGPGEGSAVAIDGFDGREYDGAARPDLGRDAFLAVLRSHVDAWVSVERASWRTFEYLLHPDGARAFFSVHFEIGGPLPEGTRADVQASLEGEAVLLDNKWKLRRLALVEGIRLQSNYAAFDDITDPAGFHWNESEAARENLKALINARGPNTIGGLSVVDWNRDGFPDVIATLSSRAGVLFLNDGSGGFLRQDLPFGSAEEAGFTCLYADLDNDGLEEIVTAQVLEYGGTTARMAVYTRRGGAWTMLPDALTFEVEPGHRDLVPQTIVPCDVDGNGYLDLFVGIYSNSQSRRERFNTIAAFDGADDLLFMNQGSLTFKEESDARGIRSTQYTLAAAFFDLDVDGDQDLIQCNDYGPNIFWENRGDGTFREDRDHILARNSAYTMGITIGDFDNTGRWSVYISNMYSHAGNRIVRLPRGLQETTRETARALAAGNWLYEQDPATGRWSETGLARRVHYGDWAWSCFFFDLDNDGGKDLFVTNGYTSHEKADAPDY